MHVQKQDSCLMFTIKDLMAMMLTVQFMNIKVCLTQGHKVENTSNKSYIINIYNALVLPNPTTEGKIRL